MKLPRRTYYHRPKATGSDQPLLDRIEQICLEYPRYGYRRVKPYSEFKVGTVVTLNKF